MTAAAARQLEARCGIDTVEIARIERLLAATPAEDLARLFSAVELADAGQLPTTCRERWTRERDRIEGQSLEFHQRVRQGFLDLAAADPDHYVVLDARAAIDEIAASIQERLTPLLEDR